MIQMKQSRYFPLVGPWPAPSCAYYGLCRRLFFGRRFFGALDSDSRRPSRLDGAGLLDLGLPLFQLGFPAGLNRRPASDPRPMVIGGLLLVAIGLVAAAHEQFLWAGPISAMALGVGGRVPRLRAEHARRYSAGSCAVGQPRAASPIAGIGVGSWSPRRWRTRYRNLGWRQTYLVLAAWTVVGRARVRRRCAIGARALLLTPDGDPPHPRARVPCPPVSPGRCGWLRPVLGDLYRGSPYVVSAFSCVRASRPHARDVGLGEGFGVLLSSCGRGHHGLAASCFRQRHRLDWPGGLSFALMYVVAGRPRGDVVAATSAAGARSSSPWGFCSAPSYGGVSHRAVPGPRLFRRARSASIIGVAL